MRDLEGGPSNVPRREFLTRHAWGRMCARGINIDLITAVLDYGRSSFIRGAQIFAIGRKEVAKFKEMGIDLTHCEGLQVVCSTDGWVLTAYKNHDFRGLRPRRRRGRRNLNRMEKFEQCGR